MITGGMWGGIKLTDNLIRAENVTYALILLNYSDLKAA